MLRNGLELQGMNPRRWRMALVFLLAPFAAYTFATSGWMTEQFGALAEQRWDLFCLCIATIGLCMRLHMAGHGQAAEAGDLVPKGELRTTGFYSVVRHPTSLANFLILLSGSLLFKSVFFTALVAAVACL